MENHHCSWVNPLFLWPCFQWQTVSLPEGIDLPNIGFIYIYMGYYMITIDFHGSIISTSTTNQGSISNWHHGTSDPHLHLWPAHVCYTRSAYPGAVRKCVDRQCHISHIIHIILKDPQIRYQLIKQPKNNQKTTKPMIYYKTSKYSIYIYISGLGYVGML